jgi:hypothetical protein
MPRLKEPESVNMKNAGYLFPEYSFSTSSAVKSITMRTKHMTKEISMYFSRVIPKFRYAGYSSLLMKFIRKVEKANPAVRNMIEKATLTYRIILSGIAPSGKLGSTKRVPKLDTAPFTAKRYFV